MTLIALVLAASVFGSEAPLPPGHERYIVVLHRNVKDKGKNVGEETTKAGGKLEADLGDRLIITAPPPAIEKLIKHADVKYVQKAVVGVTSTTDDLSAPRTMSIAPAPIQSNALTWTSGDYVYDGSGNIEKIGTAAAPGTQGYRTYGYDSVTRLTKAQISGVTPGGTYEYSYDVYGNRTGAAVGGQWSTVSVSSTTNRLNDAGYDASGNQESRGSTAATYDGFSMATSYEFDGTNAGIYGESLSVNRYNDARIRVNLAAVLCALGALLAMALPMAGAIASAHPWTKIVVPLIFVAGAATMTRRKVFAFALSILLIGTALRIVIAGVVYFHPPLFFIQLLASGILMAPAIVLYRDRRTLR